jgi:hypothetical protein
MASSDKTATIAKTVKPTEVIVEPLEKSGAIF